MAGILWGAIYVAIAGYAFSVSSFFTFFVLFAISNAFRVLYNGLIYPEYLSPLKHIPTPRNRSWINGNPSTFYLQTPFQELSTWVSDVPNDGLLRFYIVGNMERVLLTSPKALRELLVQNPYDFPKPEQMRIQLARMTGKNGLLLVEGQEHKRQRKNLQPAFSYRHIKDLYPVFWAKSVEMVKCIEKSLRDRNNSEDNVVKVGPWASRATLDIIGLAGMDQDFGSLANPNNELAKQYHRVFLEPSLFTKVLFTLGFLLGNIQIIHKLPLQRNRDIKEGSEYVRSVARRIVNEKKEKMKNDASSLNTGGIDIISVALESGTFTDEELVDQMMTFLAAGHETTSTALQWAVYALCKNPDVQTRLREEIRANLPSISVENPEPVTAATLDSLPYLHAVCNEVLRFHPSVPLTFRIATHDTTLVGIPIPKGTLLVVSPEITNHRKDLWGEDADKFNPDRWLGQGRANTGGADNNYSFLTFLHGARACIGQGFAKSELASLIAVFVGRFHMELKDPNAKLEVKEAATVAPRDGVLARLTPLEGW